LGDPTMRMSMADIRYKHVSSIFIAFIVRQIIFYCDTDCLGVGCSNGRMNGCSTHQRLCLIVQGMALNLCLRVSFQCLIICR
jgi:hypothetical protein